MNRRTNYQQRNLSSVDILVQSFLKNLEQFHLPTLPSIKELSDASRNVTLEVQRELEENFERLPSFKKISEISKNMTDDIQSNVQQLENGFSEFSKNFTDEFQTNLQNFQLPNLEELSQFSRNVTKDFKSNLKDLSMFSKNASENLQNIAKNVSFGIENRLRNVAELPQVVTLSEMSKNFTSDFGDFLFSEADKLSKYSKNVTKNVILPTLENLSRLSKNLTNELEVNIRRIHLPDINELVLSVRNFTHLFEVAQNKSTITDGTPPQEIPKEKTSPIQMMQDAVKGIISPLANIKKLIEDFKIKSTSPREELDESESDNLIEVQPTDLENEKPKFPTITATIVSSLKTLKTLIGNVAKNQEKIAIAVKAVPTLMPYILEANTPSLDTFLKEGTQFSLKDLSTIHSALINFHNFVSDTRDSMDKIKAPTFHNLALLIKQRNLGLLNIILQLMVRADREKDGIVLLNQEDISNVEKNMISPKEFYQVLFESKNVKEHYLDRHFKRAFV